MLRAAFLRFSLLRSHQLGSSYKPVLLPKGDPRPWIRVGILVSRQVCFAPAPASVPTSAHADTTFPAGPAALAAVPIKRASEGRFVRACAGALPACFVDRPQISGRTPNFELYLLPSTQRAPLDNTQASFTNLVEILIIEPSRRNLSSAGVNLR